MPLMVPGWPLFHVTDGAWVASGGVTRPWGFSRGPSVSWCLGVLLRAELCVCVCELHTVMRGLSACPVVCAAYAPHECGPLLCCHVCGCVAIEHQLIY